MSSTGREVGDLGFLGRGSSPDEIFWEREAELHQEDEELSAFDRPHIGQEALEEIADDEDEEIVRTTREGRRCVRLATAATAATASAASAGGPQDPRGAQTERRDESRRDEPPSQGSTSR